MKKKFQGIENLNVKIKIFEFLEKSEDTINKVKRQALSYYMIFIINTYTHT